ncbi:solute carrier family 3 member 2b isoform X1 [Myripristis murdjan]|uniref:solute carrier family 3 member 2b isoform X1 n=1 Tax=Myripristis murdjan TaxID=586833 RepID=UPI00117638FB|nr:4F2 cell-surface antigen heavy chain-like isoform X1 [Myripristis murdjan]
MSQEETNVELKEAEVKDAEVKDTEVKDTEVKDGEVKDGEVKDGEVKDGEVKDAEATDGGLTDAEAQEAELDQEEQEKQPMTGGLDACGDAASPGAAEKNGSVHLKIPEEAEVKFTGLSKEELLRVAGTPGWVRTRWALLIVFWLGWLGMLVAAVVLILQAPPCRDLPELNWWNKGPLYQIGDVQAFSQNLKGLEQRLESLEQLKVKGLVLGPIHVAPADQPKDLRFEEISPDAGNLEQFKGLVKAAHKKGISVVLDLTPNYRGSGSWFSNVSVTNVAERLKSALVFWLDQGVDGVQLAGVERVASVVPLLWSDIRAIVQNGTEERAKKRVLIGVTERTSADEVSSLLSSTGVDLLLSGVLRAANTDATERAQSIQQLYSSHNQSRLAWSLGGRADGHLATLGGPALLRLHQLLLLTLPGTPVFNYGDEIGLEDEGTNFPKMLWDSAEEPNGTLKEQQEERESSRRLFQALSELRGRERSLMFGDFLLLYNSSSSLAFLRSWDQSERYLAAFNWADEAATLPLSLPALPQHATVSLSTDDGSPASNSKVQLEALRLGPGQATLLKFPYSA